MHARELARDLGELALDLRLDLGLELGDLCLDSRFHVLVAVVVVIVLVIGVIGVIGIPLDGLVVVITGECRRGGASEQQTDHGREQSKTAHRILLASKSHGSERRLTG